MYRSAKNIALHSVRSVRLMHLTLERQSRIRTQLPYHTTHLTQRNLTQHIILRTHQTQHLILRMHQTLHLILRTHQTMHLILRKHRTPHLILRTPSDDRPHLPEISQGSPLDFFLTWDTIDFMLSVY